MPVHVATTVVTNAGDTVGYDVLRLPLSDDGARVDHVVTHSVAGRNFAAIYEFAGTKAPLDLLSRLRKPQTD